MTYVLQVVQIMITLLVFCKGNVKRQKKARSDLQLLVVLGATKKASRFPAQWVNGAIFIIGALGFSIFQCVVFGMWETQKRKAENCTITNA